ncbi:MAG: hypothetical protein QOI09_2158 [Chloroflexota bacterium]|jgi:hypothetical protein|nr:hypothetical protein [Chloroflexota bacterium]
MMQPMYDGGFSLLGVGIIAVGFIGLVLGCAIILRITRDPEHGSDHWRSHRR